MAVTAVGYGLFLESLCEGRVNLPVTNELMCMICTSAYTPNQATHKFKSVVTNEITGSGYTAGGKVITGVNLTYSAKLLTIKGGNLNWPNITLADARYGVIYCAPQGAQQTEMPLVGWVDFGAAQNISGQAFYINWAAAGILTFGLP